MAFNPSNFNRNSVTPNLSMREDMNFIFLYTTSDSLATVDDSTYFDTVADKLIVGDMIGVTASDGKAVYFVTTSNRNDNVSTIRYI